MKMHIYTLSYTSFLLVISASLSKELRQNFCLSTDPCTTQVLKVGEEKLGKSLTLTCDIIEGNPIDDVTYSWCHNGNNIAETRKEWTIDSLNDVQHDGNYTCAATNLLNNTQLGRGEYLNVTCKYFSNFYS